MVKIIKISSQLMFDGLILGLPKPGMFEHEVLKIKSALPDLPYIDVSKQDWTVTGKTESGIEYGTWGHLAGVACEGKDGDARYSFCVLFRFVPELENLQDVLDVILSTNDWRSIADVWDIGDL
jgi:hypothetical protein